MSGSTKEVLSTGPGPGVVELPAVSTIQCPFIVLLASPTDEVDVMAGCDSRRLIVLGLLLFRLQVCSGLAAET